MDSFSDILALFSTAEASREEPTSLPADEENSGSGSGGQVYCTIA